MSCQRCDDTGWVCERHDDRPHEDSPRSCRVTSTCRGAGMPCPDCNDGLQRGVDDRFDAIDTAADSIPADKRIH